MSLKHGLLGLLNYGTMTGYQLDKAFKESLNFFWQAQTSQIYRELNDMEKCGMLTSEIVMQTDKPNKRLYKITADGKNELCKWLSTDSENIVRSQFLMKIFFAGIIEKNQALEVLKAFRSRNEAFLSELAGTEKSIENYGSSTNANQMLFWNLVADYGVANARMCIQWADNAIKILEEAYENNRN